MMRQSARTGPPGDASGNDERPRVTTPRASSDAQIASTTTSTATVTRRARRAIESQPGRVAPIALASVFPPGGRRRLWMYTYGCKICGTFSLGRARNVDGVTGMRRASCGHYLNVVAARVYSAPKAAA